MQNTVEERERAGDVGAPLDGLEGQQLANGSEDVTAPFARRQEQFDLVAEEQQADFVAVARG